MAIIAESIKRAGYTPRSVASIAFDLTASDLFDERPAGWRSFQETSMRRFGPDAGLTKRAGCVLSYPQPAARVDMKPLTDLLLATVTKVESRAVLDVFGQYGTGAPPTP